MARIAVPGSDGPTGLAVSDGSLWVQSHRITKLSRIDPASNRVIRELDIGQKACGQPLAAFGEIWLQPCDSSTSTIAVDAKTTTVHGSVGDAGGTVMAAAAGSVWVAAYELNAVKRVDPTTLKLEATIRVPSGLIADGDGAIWSAGLVSDSSATDGHLSKINPETNRVVAQYRIPKVAYPMMTFAYGKVWIKGNDTAGLIKIDPGTGKESTVDLAGWQPLSQFYETPIAAARNALWVRLTDSLVGQIDPTTGRVIGRYPADAAGGGGYPIVAFGSLWVANFGADTVWRDRLPG